MSTNWPDAERFDNCIRQVGRITMDDAVKSLDAANYWPEPRPLSHKRAHVRWMMRRMADKEGRRRWFECSDKETSRREPAEQDAVWAEHIASTEWETLEEIRQKMVRLNPEVAALSERKQVWALETLFGTEEEDGELSYRGGEPFPHLFVCHLDENAADPEPVYKAARFLMRDEFKRYIDRVESRMREAKDDIRTLRAISGFRDKET